MTETKWRTTRREGVTCKLKVNCNSTYLLPNWGDYMRQPPRLPDRWPAQIPRFYLCVCCSIDRMLSTETNWALSKRISMGTFASVAAREAALLTLKAVMQASAKTNFSTWKLCPVTQPCVTWSSWWRDRSHPSSTQKYGGSIRVVLYKGAGTVRRLLWWYQTADSQAWFVSVSPHFYRYRAVRYCIII